ncbi:MAG: DUF488 domain-containing protein [Verrucomicrobiota bacterium]
MNTLFTIGHSDHELATLVQLLRQHKVAVVADVRSQPYSARLPQFNKELLERGLRENGLQYVFLGVELGARRDEAECYVDGQARYELVAKTIAFAKGLQRVRNGLGKFNVALLCAEKDPLTCHRTILVCRHLRGLGFPIQHIHEDGSLEPHEAAEERLLQITGDAEPFLFASHQEQIERAYDRQGLKIAYRQTPSEPEAENQFHQAVSP